MQENISVNLTLEDIIKTVVVVLKSEEMKEISDIEGYVSRGAVKQYKDILDYPPTMDAKDIKEFLGISETTAYEVLNSAKCPTIRIGKRMLVARESFYKFIQESEGKQIL